MKNDGKENGATDPGIPVGNDSRAVLDGWVTRKISGFDAVTDSSGARQLFIPFAMTRETALNRGSRKLTNSAAITDLGPDDRQRALKLCHCEHHERHFGRGPRLLQKRPFMIQ
jgi:hypothetical protein